MHYKALPAALILVGMFFPLLSLRAQEGGEGEEVELDMDSFDFSTTKITVKPNPTELAGTGIPVSETAVAVDISSSDAETAGISTTSVPGTETELAATGPGLAATNVVLSITAIPSGGKTLVVQPQAAAPLPLRYSVHVPLYFGVVSNNIRVSDGGLSGDSITASDMGLPLLTVLAAPEFSATWNNRFSGRLSLMSGFGISGTRRPKTDTTIGDVIFPNGENLKSKLEYMLLGFEGSYRVASRPKWYAEAGMALLYISATETIESAGVTVETQVLTPVIPALTGRGRYFLKSSWGVVALEAQLTFTVSTGSYLDLRLGASHEVRPGQIVQLDYRLHRMSYDDKADNSDADVKLDVMFNGPQVSYIYAF